MGVILIYFDFVQFNNVFVWFLMMHRLKCFHCWKKHRINNNARISQWPKIDLKRIWLLVLFWVWLCQTPSFWEKRDLFWYHFSISWVVSFCFLCCCCCACGEKPMQTSVTFKLTFLFTQHLSLVSELEVLILCRSHNLHMFYPPC